MPERQAAPTLTRAAEHRQRSFDDQETHAKDALGKTTDAL
jgi:hypothetical protein